MARLPVRLLAMAASRSLNGAIAGGLAAAAWAAQQPLDKRVFGVEYDDIELLGKAVTRGSEWPAVGLALHIANGAAFGALYAQLRPFLFGPPVLRAVSAALAENVSSWPLIGFAEQHLSASTGGCCNYCCKWPFLGCCKEPEGLS